MWRRPGRRLLHIALAAGSLLPGCSGATTHMVSTFEELGQAIQHLGHGDTVEFGADIAVASRLTIWGQKNITLTSSVDGGGEAFTLDGNVVTSILQIKEGAEVNVSNLIFRNGRGGPFDPGGLAVRSGSRVNLDGVTFSGHRIAGDTFEGGALSVSRSTVFMTNCTFLDNEVSSGLGGAAARIEDSDVRLTSCTLQGNRATGGLGGALYIGSASGSLTVVLDSCVLRDNSYTHPWGAFHAGALVVQANSDRAESVTLINCEFAGNTGAPDGRDIDFLGSGTSPDTFQVLSPCPAGDYDAAASGTLSCADCPGGPYPASFGGSCVSCPLYTTSAGGWTCELARCSSIGPSAVQALCGTVDRAALISDAADWVCAAGACVDSDAETCCAATCDTMANQTDNFCKAWGLGLVEDAALTSCLGTNCTEADAATCCKIPTTTRTTTSTTFTSTTRTSTTSTTTTATTTTSTTNTTTATSTTMTNTSTTATVTTTTTTSTSTFTSTTATATTTTTTTSTGTNTTTTTATASTSAVAIAPAPAFTNATMALGLVPRVVVGGGLQIAEPNLAAFAVAIVAALHHW